MTKEEKRLWCDFLKYLPVTVHREKEIGNYTANFYCEEANVAIEIGDSAAEKDYLRDSFFKRRGITVLRYTNQEIRQKFDEVCMDIMRYIDEV